jgi:hypothetical protein
MYTIYGPYFLFPSSIPLSVITPQCIHGIDLSVSIYSPHCIGPSPAAGLGSSLLPLASGLIPPCRCVLCSATTLPLLKRASKFQPLLQPSSHAIPQKVHCTQPPHHHLHKALTGQVQGTSLQSTCFPCQHLYTSHACPNTSVTIVQDSQASWIARRSIASAMSIKNTSFFVIALDISLLLTPRHTQTLRLLYVHDLQTPFPFFRLNPPLC